MFNKIGQFFIIILMTLGLSGQVHAQDDSDMVNQTTNEVVQLLDTKFVDDDYFHHILAFMWGDFIFDNKSGGIEVSPLSKVVGFVNVLALILGIVIVTYVSLGSVINSASSGEVLGKSWSTYWLPLRTAMSFGLIIPSSAGAYTLSTVQVLVIKLIIIASSSATYLWKNTVNDFFQVPGSSQILSTVGYPYQTAYDLSSMAFCSASNLYVRIDGGSNWFWNFSDEEYKSNSFIQIHYLNMKDPKTTSTRSAKSDIKEISEGLGEFKLEKSRDPTDIITRISFADGQCGSISFDIPQSLLNPDPNDLEFYQDEEGPTGQLSALTEINAKKVKLLLENQAAMIDYFEKMFVHAHTLAGDITIYGKEPDEFMGKASFEHLLDLYMKMPEKSRNDAMENNEIAAILTNKGASVIKEDGTEKRLGKAILFDLTEEFIDNYRKSVFNIYKNMDNNTPTEDTIDGEALSLTKGGWVLAGAAYFKMSDYVSIASQSYEILGSTSPASPNAVCTADDKSFECLELRYLQSSIEILGAYFSLTYRDTAYRINGLVENTNNSNDPNTPNDSKAQIESRFAAAKAVSLSSPSNIISNANPDEMVEAQQGMISSWMISALQDIGSWGFYDGVSQRSHTEDGGFNFADVNPYQDAIALGHGMNTVKVLAYAASAATTIGMNQAQYLQSASTSGSILAIFTAKGGILLATIEGVLEAVLPLLYLMVTLSTALAWALAYYIPMMPIILWITLVSAYCVIAIEAVVAAPLALIMAATPEGEGIAGQRMEQAIKLLASVLLRPSLMIIGLFASIYIAKISYVVFVTLFWQQATMYVGDGLFSTFAIIVIYVTVLHQLLNRSIMVMDTLPSSILSWIGGGGNNEFGQKSVESVSQAVEQGSSGLTEASKAMVGESRRRRMVKKEGLGGGSGPATESPSGTSNG